MHKYVHKSNDMKIIRGTLAHIFLRDVSQSVTVAVVNRKLEWKGIKKRKERTQEETRNHGCEVHNRFKNLSPAPFSKLQNFIFLKKFSFLEYT